MRKFLQYILLIILFSAFGIILTNKEQARQAVQQVKTAAQKELGVDQPCGKPLQYSIGNIDPKFNISQNDLAQMAQLAADIWNKAEGRTLLEYNPNAQFKINLVYDSRQEQSDAASQLEQNLQNLESANSSLTKKYNSLSSAYRQKIDAYNKDLENYKSDADKFNSDVSYWNSQGGAPADEYSKLQKEKSNLDYEYKNLNQERQDVNKLAGLTNNVASQENQAVANYNSNVETYTSQYGGTQEFEKGVFDGKEINIYQYEEMDDLRLTLAHELGHYIGLEHVENSKSIMYPLIGDQDMNNIQPTAEDLAELKKICNLY